MAYAQLSDVKARAGVLSDAWSRDTKVSDGEIEKMIEQVSSELDASIGATGAAVPVTDTVAANALVGVTTDKALLLAIDATWPGGGGEVDGLRAQVAERVAAYDEAITNEKLGALMYLSSSTSAFATATESGASNFWTSDADEYQWWNWYSDRLSGWGHFWGYDPWGVPTLQGPRFTKDMRL